MKKTCIIALLASILLSACTKKDYTINNTTTIGPSMPSFIVNGLTGITFTNNYATYTTLHLTVQYMDSAQENVTLAISGLPAGIGMDTTWQNTGIPTFSTDLTIFDTLGPGAVPGNYTFTLTATTVSGGKKQFPVNLKVLPMPTKFLGKYNNCRLPCGMSTSVYSDSLYQDATTSNKIWFTNFGNTGSAAYGTIDFDGKMTIPVQTIGGITYSGTGTINLIMHAFTLNVHAGSTSCSLIMAL